MSEAFEGNGEHSLIANLRSLEEEDWRWIPPDGARSIAEIVQHVGECKYVYENHAFGDGSMRWDRPGSIPAIKISDRPAMIIDWLREGHRRLALSAASLSDDRELLAMRPANWGQRRETRWLLNVMLQHDLYHSGEINHIRALRQGNDRWEHPTSTYHIGQGEVQ
jgi:uncharacterized damage-inducible protein DinB